MPSIRVRALPQNDDADIPGTMARLRDVAAEHLEVPPARVRVLWQELDPGAYLQGDTAPLVQPHDSHPPTAELVAFVGRSPEVVRAVLEALADELASGLALEPGNAWVSYVEAADGELYVDGAIKRVTA